MNDKDKHLLLNLARNVLENYFKDIDPDTTECSHLTMLRGCFVTLYKNRMLRGCIGFPRPVMPLFEQVIAATKAAAFEDPRFDPVIDEELKSIKIEISILTAPKLMKVSSQDDYLNNVHIGQDGLIMHYKNSTGLLLPQVATENHFRPLQFLEALCIKAGLPRDCWKQNECIIYKFQAEIFSE